MKTEKETKATSKNEVSEKNEKKIEVKEEKEHKKVTEAKQEKTIETQKKETKNNNSKLYGILFIASCVLLLFVGGVFGYWLGHHNQHKRGFDGYFPYGPSYDRMAQDPENIIKHHRERMEHVFDDMESEFFGQGREFFDDRWNDEYDHFDELEDFDKLEDFDSGRDNHARGSFKFYQKTSNNGENTSYEVNGNWNEGDDEGSMVINGVNTEGKTFSYSGTMQDGKSEGVLIDEDGNTKEFSLDGINISDIYDSSNHIED